MALVALLSSEGQDNTKLMESSNVRKRGAGRGERCREFNQLEDCRFYWSQNFVGWNTCFERMKAAKDSYGKKRRAISRKKIK